MSSTSDLKFFDNKLAEAVNQSIAELDNFQKSLDEATADIKTLEKYLQSTGFCISTFVSVPSDLCDEIGWDKQGDSWKLLSRTWDRDTETHSIRALSDSNARLRLGSRPYLSELVAEITNTLTSAKEPRRADVSFI